MAYSVLVGIDNLRSLGFASISGSYATVGSTFGFPVRLICITNNTNGDMLFSTDGSNDKLFVAAKSFKLFDLTTNRDGTPVSTFMLPVGTQIWVKQSTAASSGSVYVEVIYGIGDA